MGTVVVVLVKTLTWQYSDVDIVERKEFVVGTAIVDVAESVFEEWELSL